MLLSRLFEYRLPAKSIFFSRASAHPHPHVQAVVKNYATLLEATGLSEPEVLAKLNELTTQAGIRIVR